MNRRLINVQRVGHTQKNTHETPARNTSICKQSLFQDEQKTTKNNLKWIVSPIPRTISRNTLWLIVTENLLWEHTREEANNYCLLAGNSSSTLEKKIMIDHICWEGKIRVKTLNRRLEEKILTWKQLIHMNKFMAPDFQFPLLYHLSPFFSFGLGVGRRWTCNIAHPRGAKPYAKRGRLQGKPSTMQSEHLHAYACFQYTKSVKFLANFKKTEKADTSFRGSYVRLFPYKKKKRNWTNPCLTYKKPWRNYMNQVSIASAIHKLNNTSAQDIYARII